jgi:hypothetical protein
LRYEDKGGPVTGSGSYTEKWKMLWKVAKDAGVKMDEEQAVIVFVNLFPSSLDWTLCTGRLLKETKLNAAAAELQENYQLLNKNKSSKSFKESEDTVAAMNTRIQQLEAFIAYNKNTP